MKIKVGDKVVVLSGKDKNKTGTVLKTDRKTGKVLIEKINIVTKHIKKSQSGEQGRIVKVERPMDVSNIMLVCPITQKRTRIGYTGTGKDKRRVSKKAGKTLEDIVSDPKKK